MTSPRLSRRRPFSVILAEDPRAHRGFAFELIVSVQKRIDPQSGMGVNLRDMDAFLKTVTTDLATVASGWDLLQGLETRVKAQAAEWSAEAAAWSLSNGEETWTSNGNSIEYSLSRRGRATTNSELANDESANPANIERDLRLTCTWAELDPDPLQPAARRHKQLAAWLTALKIKFEPESLFNEDPTLKRLEWRSPFVPETRILEKTV